MDSSRTLARICEGSIKAWLAYTCRRITSWPCEPASSTLGALPCCTKQRRCRSHDQIVALCAQPAYGAGLPAMLRHYLPWRARREVLKRFASVSRDQARFICLRWPPLQATTAVMPVTAV